MLRRRRRSQSDVQQEGKNEIELLFDAERPGVQPGVEITARRKITIVVEREDDIAQAEESSDRSVLVGMVGWPLASRTKIRGGK